MDIIIITISCLFTLWPKRKGIYTTALPAQGCHEWDLLAVHTEGSAWLCWSRTFSHQCVEKATPSTDAERVQRLEEQVYLRESLNQETEDGGKLENFIAGSGSGVQHCMSPPNVREVSLKGEWERVVWAGPSHMLLASQIPQRVSLCSPLSSLVSRSNLLYPRHLLGAL